jgi:hypothetical protein
MKRSLFLLVGLSLAADTSITFSVNFDEILTRQDKKAIGLDKATPAQKKAFEIWAQQFATGVVQKQHDADIADDSMYKFGFICGQTKEAMMVAKGNAPVVEQLNELFTAAHCRE